MNRITSSALGMTAVLAVFCGNAIADDITKDKTPRAIVKTSNIAKYGVDEWSLQMNEPAQLKSSYTSDQARADFTASRRELNALHGEDSGSMYLSLPQLQGGTRAMGAPGR